MQTLSLRLITSFLLCANFSLSSGATIPIGVVTSDGRFKLNNTETTGNVTVMDGSSFQTGRSSVSIRLNDGARITFAANSRGRINKDQLIFEKGSVEIAGYSLNANKLKINADHSSSATVTLRGAVVSVTASSGDVHVFNADGVNVANLAPGDSLNLRPGDAMPNALSSMVGCVTRSGKSYLLTDTTSKVAVLLHGSNLTPGEALHVSGYIVAEPNSSPDAPKGFKIVSKNVLPGGCQSLAAKSAAAGLAAGTIAGTGAAGAGAAAGAAGAGAAAGAAGAGAAAGAAGAGAAAAGAGAAAAGAAGAGAAAAGAAAAGAAAATAAVSTTVIAGVAVAVGAGTAVGLAVTAGSSLSSGR